MDNNLPQDADTPLQILTFTLADTWYGLDISHINEVIEMKQVTKVPRTEDYMLGVFNLRGQVIPLIDLRLYFNLEATPATIDSCIIIVNLQVEQDQLMIGLLADSVDEVVEFSRDALALAPKIGNTIDRAFIQGMLDYEEHFIMLLSLQKIFSHGELKGVVQLVDNTH